MGRATSDDGFGELNGIVGGGVIGLDSVSAPSLTTRLEFRRCENDAKFFEELIEGERTSPQVFLLFFLSFC